MKLEQCHQCVEMADVYGWSYDLNNELVIWVDCPLCWGRGVVNPLANETWDKAVNKLIAALRQR
jgi:hypothetical protein